MGKDKDVRQENYLIIRALVNVNFSDVSPEKDLLEKANCNNQKI